MDAADLLYDDTCRGPRYTYGLRCPPLGYAQVPPGWVIHSDRPHPEYPHGTVDYPRPLAAQEAQSYELELVAETPGGNPGTSSDPPAWGLLRALNLPRSKDRDAYLALQGLSWLDFILFSGASFGLRSHANGLVLTVAYLKLTLLSLYVALARLRDGKLALSLSTLTAWLVIAAGVSLGTTLWNRDDLYDAGPFATPPEGWAKRGD